MRTGSSRRFSHDLAFFISFLCSSFFCFSLHSFLFLSSNFLSRLVVLFSLILILKNPPHFSSVCGCIRQLLVGCHGALFVGGSLLLALDLFLLFPFFSLPCYFCYFWCFMGVPSHFFVRYRPSRLCTLWGCVGLNVPCPTLVCRTCRFPCLVPTLVVTHRVSLSLFDLLLAMSRLHASVKFNNN